MEQDNRANVARLKDEVIQEYGVNPERDDLPHDVRRWVELIHEYLGLEELTVIWLKDQTADADISGKFKAVVGLRPIAYIRRLRVEWTKKLFQNGFKNRWEVSITVGYRHRSSMTMAFKEETGISSAEFIRNLKKIT